MKEMSDQVRGIVFVLLALVILFAWSHFYKPPVPPPQPKPVGSTTCARVENSCFPSCGTAQA